ncbi:unnamed protein product, partial [Acidithrix sp. C25]
VEWARIETSIGFGPSPLGTVRMRICQGEAGATCYLGIGPPSYKNGAQL